MKLVSVLVSQLLLLTFTKGLKITSKMSFDGEEKVSDLLSGDYNKTGHGSGHTAESDMKDRNYEAKIPFLLSKNMVGYEIKIPLTIEGEKMTTESSNKIKFFSGFDLFERRSTEKEPEMTTGKTVPIVKGSLSYIKPDFLIPIQNKRTTIPYPRESYTFENFWPERGSNEQKNEIEGLKPPAPVNNEWILNTTPFLLFPRNVTTSSIAPPLNRDQLGDPSVWNVLESGSWNPRDPLSWNQNRKTYWILRKPGWSDSGHNYQTDHPNYSTRNVRYPVSQGTPWNGYPHRGKFPPKGRWISCPPFEVNDIGPTARQVIPGCPQYPSANSPDVEIINVTPVSTIDDKTSFKEFAGKPYESPEEPKAGE